MRDPKRMRKILGEIYRIWKKYPDMRFGQLVDNLFVYYIMSIGESIPKDYFYIEDDRFFKYLETFTEFE